MKSLDAIIGLIKALLAGVALFFIRKSGKDSVKADIAEQKDEAIKESNKIHDAIDSDDDFNDSVSDRFRR